MMRRPPKYTHGFVDRHGKPRFYFRRAGFPRVPLPSLPWTPEFMAAYQDCMKSAAPRLVVGAARILPGTIDAAIVAYYNSMAFNSLAKETKRTRRNILERFRQEHGDKRLTLLRRDHVQAMMAKKMKTRFAARNFLKTLRALIQFAISDGRLNQDPTAGIKNLSAKTEGYRTWPEEDIAAFEAHWAVGSRERLALALLLYTAQRRSDVVVMGRQHVRGNTIEVRQQKTGTRLAIPMHPQLKATLDATPAHHLTFLTTKAGKPFTPEIFTNWFREVCNAAGLPRGTSAHGLRKAACRRLAEAGCSDRIIAAISGHKDAREVAHYTSAANQLHLAEQGIAALVNADAKRAKPRTSSGKPK